MLSNREFCYKEIFEHLPEATAVIYSTKEGEFIIKKTNRRFQKLIAREEYLNNKNIKEVFPATIIDRLIDDLKCSISTQETVDLDEKLNFSFGTRYFHYHLTPFPQKEFLPEMAVITITDITKIREIMKMQEVLTFALDHSCNPVYIVSKHSQIILTNKQACISTGYTQEEFSKMKITDLDNYWATDEIPQIITNPKSYKYPLIFETEHTRKDGSKIPVEVTTIPFSTEEEDMSYCIVQDLSKNKEIEAFLMKNDQDFMNFVEKSPDIIIRFDKKLKCRYCNEAIERITGYSQYELIGKKISETFSAPIETINFFEKNLQNVLLEKQPSAHNIQIPHATSQLPIFLLCHFAPEYNVQGQIVGILLVANDITAIKQSKIELRKQKEVAEKNSRLKSAFLAIISHEIRTPANAIVGFSDLLNDKSLHINNHDRDEFVQTISSAAKKLILVINRILELSKIKTGNITITPDYIDLRDLLSQQKSILSELCKEERKNNIEIKIDLAKLTQKVTLFNDAKLINKVLLLLEENAVKFTPKGKIIVGIKKITQDFVTLYLSDTGIGIPNDVKKIIFDPFVQVDDKLTRKYEGTGIGLSMARILAQALGGDLTVKSESGKGSTFYVTLHNNIRK